MDNWSPLFFFVLIVAIIYLYIFFARKRLLKLKDHFNGSIRSMFFYTSVDSQFQGLNFSVRIYPASKSTPAYLRIFLARACRITLKIYQETALSKIGEKIGVIQEVKVNDAAFDSNCLILSNNPHIAASHLENTNIKNAIIELFNKGFNAIKVNQKGITISKPDYDKDIDLEPQDIISALQKINLIAQGL